MKKFGSVLLLSVLLIIPALVFAEADVPKMQDSTVEIIVYTPPNSPQVLGSGFITGNGDYVITNNHVIATTANGNKIMVFVAASSKVGAQVIWSDSNKDLAILKLDQNVGAERAVTYNVHSGVKIGEDVWVIGFPGAALGKFSSTDAQFNKPKVTKGIVSDSVIEADSHVKFWQTDAAVNPGNSGGPAYNSSGEVIGIVVAKVVKADVQSIGWAIQTDELLPILDSHHIQYTVSQSNPTTTPGTGNNSPAMNGAAGGMGVILLVVGVLVIIGGIIWLIVRRSSSSAFPPANVGAVSPGTMAASPQPAVVARPPVLQAVSGTFAGKRFDMNGLLVIGRNPQKATLLYPVDFTPISRVHCMVRYDPSQGCFFLQEDAAQPSRNGTYLGNGERLIPGRDYKLNSGETFIVGEKSEVFMVQR